MTDHLPTSALPAPAKIAAAPARICVWNNALKIALVAISSAMGMGCGESPSPAPAAVTPATVIVQPRTADPETVPPERANAEENASEESANSDEGEDIDTSVLLRVLNQGERAEPESSLSVP